MARQNRTKTDDTSTEAVEAPVEGTESTPTEAPAEVVEVNIEDFKSAVTAAVAEGDPSTGTLPESAIESVNVEYRKLDGLKAKSSARDYLESQMLEAVSQLDALAARGYSDLKSNLKAGSTKAADKAPADPTAAFVQRVTSLRLAANEVASSVPENVSEDWAEQVEKLVAESAEGMDTFRTYLNTEVPEGEDKPEAPEVSPVVRAAFKLASGKVAGGSKRAASGLRRNTANHITSAFADVEVGTFLTIAEIAKHKSAEYGDDSPSQGAISARLFPTTTIEGIVPVEKGEIDGKNPKGARKVA